MREREEPDKGIEGAKRHVRIKAGSRTGVGFGVVRDRVLEGLGHSKGLWGVVAMTGRGAVGKEGTFRFRDKRRGVGVVNGIWELEAWQSRARS